MSVRDFPRHRRFTRAAACLSAVVTLAVSATACSGGDDQDAKKYTVPKSLCGVSVPASLVEPVLPGGGSVSSSSTKPNGGTEHCDVSVDGKAALRASQAWWSRDNTAATVAKAYDGIDGGQASDDARFVYADKGGVGKAASCVSSKHPQQNLYGVIQVLASDQGDRAAVKKLLTAYTRAIEKSDACG